ncbi:MAG TPA: twin-arginine translocase subunit TatC [Solirubrobacteraceae bacterium]|jgi:sec-independent protein translocase protein TatC
MRPIGHEDRLSIVDHLDELRSRVFLCLGVLVVAFGICFWQNAPLLDVLNRALPDVATGSQNLSSIPNDAAKARKELTAAAKKISAYATSPGVSGNTGDLLAAAASITKAAKDLPGKTTAKKKPLTIGVGEPFTITITVAAYFALLFTLPLIIYEGYAFVIPALTPKERRVAMPVMAVAPALFATGVAFAYLVVLPPAVHFLQGYNASRFDVLVQAKAYYTFEIFTMLGIGLAFQLPLGLLALQQLGIINSSTLTRQWRYAVVIIAVIAAAMPGADPVTTGLETLPLVLLYVASIVLLKMVDRRAAARAAAEFSDPVGSNPGG